MDLTPEKRKELIAFQFALMSTVLFAYAFQAVMTGQGLHTELPSITLNGERVGGGNMNGVAVIVSSLLFPVAVYTGATYYDRSKVLEKAWGAASNFLSGKKEVVA